MVIKKRFHLIIFMRKLLINNTVSSHELHPITSVREFGGAMKALSIGPGPSIGNFSFNSIFIDKKDAFCKLFYSELI